MEDLVKNEVCVFVNLVTILGVKFSVAFEFMSYVLR